MYTFISFMIIGIVVAGGLFAVIVGCARQVEYDRWELRRWKLCKQQHRCDCRRMYQCQFMTQMQYNPFWDGSDDF